MKKKKITELFIDLQVLGGIVRNERNIQCKMPHVLFRDPGHCKVPVCLLPVT